MVSQSVGEVGDVLVSCCCYTLRREVRLVLSHRLSGVRHQG